MPSNRIGRINEEVMRELARLLPTVKDPRLGGGLLSKMCIRDSLTGGQGRLRLLIRFFRLLGLLRLLGLISAALGGFASATLACVAAALAGRAEMCIRDRWTSMLPSTTMKAASTGPGGRWWSARTPMMTGCGTTAM